MVYCTRNRAVRDTNERMRRVLVPAEYLIYTAVNLDDEGGLRSSVVSWHISVGGQETYQAEQRAVSRLCSDVPTGMSPGVSNVVVWGTGSFGVVVSCGGVVSSNRDGTGTLCSNQSWNVDVNAVCLGYSAETPFPCMFTKISSSRDGSVHPPFV
jgi:hypothetical protein